MTKLIAGIAVEKTALHFDKIYDYIIPENLLESAQIGCRVIVPFGNSPRRQGIIVSIFEETEAKKGLKRIKELLDSEPVLSKEMLAMKSEAKRS